MVENAVRNMFEFVLCFASYFLRFSRLRCRLRATARSAARLSVSSRPAAGGECQNNKHGAWYATGESVQFEKICWGRRTSQFLGR